MIDENRVFERPGIKEVQKFLYLLVNYGLQGIITTNYDLLIEYALGTNKFNYGIKGEILTGRGPYPLSQWQNPVQLTGCIPISKVHGSISWDSKNHYTDGRRGLTGNAQIVAPDPDKNRPIELIPMWDLAEKILGQSNHLIVFGFGFNKYDTALLELLKQSGKSISRVLLIDIAPKNEIAKELFPKAEINSTIPPPEGIKTIKSWLEHCD